MRLIDADALKEYIDTQDTRIFYGCTIAEAVKTLIDEMPSVESKTGRWVQDDPFIKPICSECGETCVGLHGFDYSLTDYCPHCGAKMEKGENINE